MEKLVTYIQNLLDVYYKEHYANLTCPKVETTQGRVYTKIIKRGTQSCVYGFVRNRDGAIFRAASWKAPDLDHIKGYLNDESTWTCCGEYGVHYDN